MGLAEVLKGVTWVNLGAQLILLLGAFIFGFLTKNANQIYEDIKLSWKKRRQLKEDLTDLHENIIYRKGTDKIWAINPYWVNVDNRDWTVQIRGRNGESFKVLLPWIKSQNIADHHIAFVDEVVRARTGQLWLRFDIASQLSPSGLETVLMFEGVEALSEKSVIVESKWSKALDRKFQKTQNFTGSKHRWGSYDQNVRSWSLLVQVDGWLFPILQYELRGMAEGSPRAVHCGQWVIHCGP